MEVLTQFGTPEQKEQWLRPLLDGEIRSGFAMTEPDVASSDATNIQLRIERDGDEYVLNGRKWWTLGRDARALQGLHRHGQDATRTARPTSSSRRSSCPLDTPGITVVRNLKVFGYADQEGHAEVALRGRPRAGDAT